MRRFYRQVNLEIDALVLEADSRGERWSYFYEKEFRYESVDGFVVSFALMPIIKAGHVNIVDNMGTLTGSDQNMVNLDLIDSAAVQDEK